MMTLVPWWSALNFISSNTNAFETFPIMLGRGLSCNSCSSLSPRLDKTSSPPVPLQDEHSGWRCIQQWSTCREKYYKSGARRDTPVKRGSKLDWTTGNTMELKSNLYQAAQEMKKATEHTLTCRRPYSQLRRRSAPAQTRIRKFIFYFRGNCHDQACH